MKKINTTINVVAVVLSVTFITRVALADTLIWTQMCDSQDKVETHCRLVGGSAAGYCKVTTYNPVCGDCSPVSEGMGGYPCDQVNPYSSTPYVQEDGCVLKHFLRIPYATCPDEYPAGENGDPVNCNCKNVEPPPIIITL